MNNPTDEQLSRAVAEKLGWREIRYDGIDKDLAKRGLPMRHFVCGDKRQAEPPDYASPNAWPNRPGD